jgi:small subunit ribosomal protein S3
MGQKTHPLGFRLGITKEHKSTWYANFNQYADILKEDDTIRTYIDTISQENSIAHVQINRNGLNDQIQLNIETGKPGILVGDLGAGLDRLLTNVKKTLPENRQLTINVFEVEKVDLNASLLADLVAEQLEKRVAFQTCYSGSITKSSKTKCQWNQNSGFWTFKWCRDCTK